MIPQQTFESYPVFGDNAPKVKPDDVKYAAGFQQADVLPAEWMNWAWNKNSKGISDANAGLSSIEAEIINVLTSRGEAPSVNNNNQLLTVLNKIKAEAALAAHPVGSLYWTSSTENPATTFGGGTWTQIKDKFVLAAGDTYANGNTGGAATVTLTANQIPSHNHSFTPSGSISVTTNPTFTGSEHSHTYTPSGSISVTTDPTFTGSAVTSGVNNRGHTHKVTASGTVSSHSHGMQHYHDRGTMDITGTVSVGENDVYAPVATGAFYDLADNGTGSDNGDGSRYRKCSFMASKTWSGKTSGSLVNQTSGNTTAKTTTDSTQPTFTGSEVTSGGESQNHTHSVTASGSISGGAYKFTGTQATLKATAGGTISGGAYSFTGTAGNTGTKGGGGAHNNMPPYIVKYCWERTA